MTVGTEGRAYLSEDVGTTSPPAAVDLPKLQPEPPKPASGPKGVLVRLATFFFGSSSTPRPNRAVHKRPSRGFD